MAEMKTKLTDLSVGAFLNKIVDEQKRMDAFAISESMKKITKSEARMWGPVLLDLGIVRTSLPRVRKFNGLRLGFPQGNQISLCISHRVLASMRNC